MADLLDDLADRMRNLLGSGQAHEPIVSAAPGGGPEADRESNRVQHGGRIGEHRTRGRDALGYGGHGDAVFVEDDVSAEVRQIIRDKIHSAQQRGLREPRPTGRIRMSKAFSPEAHIEGSWQFVSGPQSLFDGTATAPSAGNSIQVIPVTMPNNQPSPVMLLNRYPGAMYMSIFVRSFAIQPTGSTMTGLQECWFNDPTGAVVGLGIYNPAQPTNAVYQSINSLCNGTITDPGNTQIGTITLNNIGIGGTPVSVRWQLTVAYVAFYPDPWFNEQVIVPPTPAEVDRYFASAGAQGG